MPPRLESENTVKSDVQLHHYYKFAACSRGFTVAWMLMTVCFMIINIIVFIIPEWIGDTPSSRTGSNSNYPGSPGVGHVGLFKLCEYVSFGHKQVCDGSFQDFSTILTDAFRASTFFIGVSCLLIFLCILLFLLFLCVYEVYVYVICGSLQVISTVFMFLGCVIFPAGWDHMYVRRICGDDVGKHKIGHCEMRWSYILAIVGIFDILILAILAFVLAARHRRKWKNLDQAKQKPAKGEPKGYVVDVSQDGTTAPLHHRTASSVGSPNNYGRTSGMYRLDSVEEPRLRTGTGQREEASNYGHGNGNGTRRRNGHDSY